MEKIRALVRRSDFPISAPPGSTSYPQERIQAITTRKEADVQDAFNLFLIGEPEKKIPPKSKLTLGDENFMVEDSHARHSGLLMPDLLMITKKLVGISRIIVNGELRAPKKTFEKDDMGQVLEVAQRLLLNQPWRPHVWSFLTDSHSYVFYKSFRSNNEFGMTVEEYSFSAEDGFNHLCDLLRASPHDLGFGIMPPDSVALREYLGNGVHCTAFEAEYNATEVVLKYHDCLSNGDKEKKVLQHLNQCRVLHVPTFLLQVDNFTVVQPVGRNFNIRGAPLISAPMACVLVDLLQLAHNHLLVHRDIKPSNLFYYHRSDNLYPLLSDWTSSAGILQNGRLDINSPFTTNDESTPEFSQGLDGIRDLRVRDLHMLVRTVFAIHSWISIPPNPNWGQIFDAFHWKPVVVDRDQCDYNRVKDLFKEKLPATTFFN